MIKTLTDLWNSFCEFFGIEEVEPIVPEEPPKPYEPAESVTPLPETIAPIVPVEPIEPLPPEPFPPQIGEKGKGDRITVLPAKEEPETPFIGVPSEEDYPCTMRFHTRCEGMPVAGVDVTFLGQTATTDSAGKCSISGRAKINKNYPITASKAGYKKIETEVSFAFAPRSGLIGGDKRLNMERM